MIERRQMRPLRRLLMPYVRLHFDFCIEVFYDENDKVA